MQAWATSELQAPPQQGMPQDTVLCKYHEYGVVFSKQVSERMPTCKPYDHAIDIMPSESLLKPAKLYLLNLAE